MVTDALRAVVAQRANGRCEYCLIDEQDTGFPHQVDHIVSRKHGGPSTLENPANRENFLDYFILARIVGRIISVCTVQSLSRFRLLEA